MKFQVKVHVVDLDDGWVFVYLEAGSQPKWPVALFSKCIECKGTGTYTCAATGNQGPCVLGCKS